MSEAETIRAEIARKKPPRSLACIWWIRRAGLLLLTILCVVGAFILGRLTHPIATATQPPVVLPSATATRSPTATITPTPIHLPAQIIDPVGHVMALVPAGEFQMGSEIMGPQERPIHMVFLYDFYMDVYAVTNKQFAQFLTLHGNPSEGGETWLDIERTGAHIAESNGRFAPEGGFEDYPVVEVTWYGAQAYCQWRMARLPTEAEWEKAARGGLEGKLYPWGDEEPTCEAGALNGAQFASCGMQIAPVGLFAPNGYGLFDMVGNTSEWVADWFAADYYSVSPVINPLGPFGHQAKGMRGGYWGSIAIILRLAYRGGAAPPNHSSPGLGFRCARSP